MLDSGVARVGFHFEISDLKVGDTISFLPAPDSFEEEGPFFMVVDPTTGAVGYKLGERWTAALIKEIEIPGVLRFSFRDPDSGGWRDSEFSPVRVAIIERPSVMAADIRELERLRIFTP
ncbi:MAG: hypothetical protein HYT39_02170 [Candidatus Sungbacteria bacterium]|nr:hypothetical protein [Candidatus Sungbacteria bacterium]